VKAYRKKPETVYAQQYVGQKEWLDPELQPMVVSYSQGGPCQIELPNGNRMTVNPGEWIIRDSHGWSVLKEKSFFSIYEEVR
jgi:hypothetical protein